MEPSLSERGDLIRCLTRCELVLEELRQLIRQTRSTPNEHSSPPIDQLPPEMLSEIFRYLSPRDLCNVRLSCRKWSAAVACSSRLMLYFPIRINSAVLEENRHRIKSLLASSCRFSKVELSNIELDNPGICYWFMSIWRNVCQSIQSLRIIQDCNIPLSVILQMLAGTVNLKEFRFNPCETTSFDELEKADFPLKLHNLQKLGVMVTGPNPVEPLFKWFQRICPTNIRIIKLCVYNSNTRFTPGYEKGILDLVRMCCRTLEEIEIIYTDQILLEMAEIRELDLRQVRISGDVLEENVVHFIKTKRNIEHLHYMLIHDFETLVEISTYLPKLKWAVFIMSDDALLPADCDLTFLMNMPKLADLVIHLPSTNMLWLKTSSFICPNLVDLGLIGVRFSRHVLLNSLRQAPNIRKIRLRKCKFDYQSDVVHLITQLQTLEQFELVKTTFENHDSPDLREISGFSNIRHFELSLLYDNNAQWFARMLINLCPLVEKLNLVKVADDNVIREVCQCLPQLDDLELYKCQVTENGIMQLISYQQKTNSLGTIRITMTAEQETQCIAFENMLAVLENVYVEVVMG